MDSGSRSMEQKSSQCESLRVPQLFIFRDLWAWLNNPLHGPPAARQLAEQLPMPLIW
jgi:hypothetical protein